MRRQYERAWRRDKSSENRSHLRRQINRCNHILNRNKGCFYRDLVSENCGDSKMLWHALNRTLIRSNSTVLPSFDDEKSLANRFGSFCIDKIKKIRDTFKYTRSQVLHPDKEPTTFSSFQVVTDTEVLCLSRNPLQKLVPLIHAPITLWNNVLTFFSLHWLNWLTCPSKMAFSLILSNRLLSHPSSKSPPFQKFTVHKPSELYVLVSSALPTTHRYMTCTMLKAT